MTSTLTPTPATFLVTVNSTGDGADAVVGNGVCQTATAGECTLRAALQESAARPGGEAIIFNIAGSGVHTITPGSPLPTAFEVTIEGTSQPGYAGSPLIELRGTAAGAADGLVIGGTSGRPAIVRGLAINGFSGDGIEVFSSGPTVIERSYIGTLPDGTTAMGNGGHGIHSAGADTTIGSSASGARNIIAFNGGDGVFVRDTTRNRISRNSIFSNTGLGIDLAPEGVTPNDPQDPDTGANNLQNFPVITAAAWGGSPRVVQIAGTLNSTPNTSFALEFFRDTAVCDPALIEGRTFVGSSSVTTDGNGDAFFSVQFPDIPFGDGSVTATATDPLGNTSEFSACTFVAHFDPTPTPTPTPTATPVPTPTPTVSPTPTPTPTPTVTPTPTPVHDAAIVRLRTVHNVRLAPNVPDVKNTTVVVGQSLGDHVDPASVYLAFNPPGGFGANPGGCSVFVPTASAEENANQVYNWTSVVLSLPSVLLDPGQKITLNGNVEFQCANPAAVDGDNWQVLAIADVHGEDFAFCDTLGEAFDNACPAAINDDDDQDANNSKLRPLPKVMA